MTDPNHYSSWGVGPDHCGGLPSRVEHCAGAEWKPVVPRWVYDLVVQRHGEDEASRLLTVVDDWSVDDATF